MSLVSNAIDAMFNGVSQQPANVRLPSQCEEQVNGYGTVANGLSKRPPTQYLAKLSSSSFANNFIHIINRDTTERYAVVIGDETLQVFDLADGSAEVFADDTNDDWVPNTAKVVDDVMHPTANNKYHYRCTVAGTTHATTEPTWPTTLGDTVGDGTCTWVCIDNYMAVPAGANINESFAIVTVADYSFIVNKTQVVYTRPTTNATHAGKPNWYFPTNWTKAGPDERYYIPVAGTDKGQKQTLADLPLDDDPSPPSNGDFYEITGDDSTGFSSFYVFRQSGVWIETHERNTSTAPDEHSMPHALVREADNEFHLREFGWVPRFYGDFLTNPDPSFVGKAITDIGFHKNRLVVASGENITFSGAGDYGNWYRNTVSQLLDSDVVDVAVSSQNVSNINFILPAENSMMFFSDQTQFVLNVDQLLTPSTVSIDVATTYDMNPKVKPITIGQDVYFAAEAGNYTRIREYDLGIGDIATDATDVTAHVEKFIPKNIIGLAGSSNEDVLLAISNETGYKNRVYVYKFFYSGNEKVQSAWGYWEFAADDVVKAIEVLNENIYFIIERADGVYLETMDIQSTTYPLALTFDVLLDRRYNFESGDKSFDSTYTTFTLPYEITAGEQADFRLVLGDGATAGRILDTTDYTFPTATTVRVTGDFTSIEVFGGLNYTFTYKFSEQFHRNRTGNAITTGKYQLRAITIVYEDTAFFSTVIDPYGTGDNITEEEIVTTGLTDFTGKTLGEASLVLDSPVFGNGTYQFQVYGNSKFASIEITNDVPFACTLVSATVEGFYTNRGR